MPNLRNGSKQDSNPGSLYCESGVLPLSYHALTSLSANMLINIDTFRDLVLLLHSSRQIIHRTCDQTMVEIFILKADRNRIYFILGL